MSIPQRTEIVIIGGGVIGASIAYHLAQRGKADVTLVERKSLTNGSTWHAAGLVGQLRSSSSLTQLMRKSVETYQALEATTGYATGWRGVGGLRVAASPGRWEELQRVCTQGKSYGFDIHLVSPAEAAEIFPLLNTDGIYGATWTPSDGYVDPSQLTLSFVTGARAAGARVVQGCRVTGIERAGRRVTAVQTEQGRIECDVVVNATGMWGAETARLAGAQLAVNAVEHQYVVTEKSDGIPRDLPTFRDPDARFYLKPEAGGLVIGGWEQGTRACWRTIPYDLGPELFKPDTERFEGLAEGAAHRVPIFGELGIQTWVNGPIPFSPDAEPVMGRTEDLDNLFHCCGFSAGIAAAGGAGDAMANWIIDGDPGLDLWPFDVRRFGAPHNVPAVLETLSVQAYGHYYDIAYPNRPAHPPRGQRRSAAYDRLAERGAVFGGKFGFERANWFAVGGGSREETPTFGRSEAWPFIEAEHAAVRAAVGVIDQSSFAKFRIRGRGALGLLQQVAGAEMDVAAGKVTYTQLLNARGGIEADVTVTRLGEEEFYLVTGSGFGRHDVTFLLQHAPADGSVTIDDVTSAMGVLNVCGPRSRALAQSLSTADFGNEAFPYMTAQQVDLGWAPVLALRATYAGELGWEFHVPTEYVRDLYDKIVAAGSHLGLRDVGYRAIESLRLEKQYLAWAGDIKPDNNPYEAGLGFAVKPDKPALLAGPALRAIREAGPAQRLCWFTAEFPTAEFPTTGFPATGPDVTLHGGELLACPGAGVATSVRSAGFGFTVQRNIFSAYLPAEAAEESEFEIEVMSRRFPATRHERPLYDPAGARARSLSPFRYRRRRGLPLAASPKETPKTDVGGPMAARQHLSPDEHRPADDAELAEHGYRQRLNRSLGGFSSFAAGFSYISILTGMFQLFGFGYGFGGPILFWAWLIVFGGQFCVALVFAELSARYPIAGSVYQWSKKVSNPTGAWFAGWAMLAGSVVTVAAVSIALQIVLPQIWSGFTIFSNPTQNAVFLGCCAIVLTTIINVLGVRVMAFINNIGVAAELLGVALIIVLLLFHIHRSPAVIFTAQGAGPGLPGWTALGYLAPLLICAVMPAYVMFGFDTAGSLAEETKDPRRTTPSALLRALGAAGTAGALLLLMALLTAKSLAPATLGVGGLPSVLEDALGSGVGKVLLADVAFAIFICCLAIHAASIRLAFSMARDHALPFGDHLSHVSAQRKSPALPAIAVGVVAIAILIVNFGNAQIFLVVTSVSIVIVYIAYLLVTVPAMLQRRRHGWPEDQGRTGWFFLGRRRGLLINGTAIGYGLLMALNLIWPRTAIYGSGAYAWGGVIVVAAIMLVGAAYYFWRQHGREHQVAPEHRAEQLASAVGAAGAAAGGEETSA